MYLSHLAIRNFRQFGDGDAALDVSFSRGVTALIGKNDSGKSAIIDAIRYALLTRDQEYIRVQPDDFHIGPDKTQSEEITIRCTLSELTDLEKGTFAEHLTYVDGGVALHVTWAARIRPSASPGSRRWVDISIRSGANGTGPTLETTVRELLSGAYLRPLRDAEREMSSGRGSRLSQVLENFPEISCGEDFNEAAPPADPNAVSRLSLVGLSDYLVHNVRNHEGVRQAEDSLNSRYLSSLTLSNDQLRGKIDLSQRGSEKIRLRQILERLELSLLDAGNGSDRGRYGLGSNNVLYMACELLLLGKELDGLPLLLIEEPEAHLHPQRQLRLMEFLTKESTGQSVQVIMTTHSPNLASKVPLSNLVLLEGARAFPLAPSHTDLSPSDYRFLERFLDVTKASLFFAHAVIIVEGDAEAILLPTLADLLGRSLTEHGVSIVNVGSTGLRRYSRIFQRKTGVSLSTPVACLADLDVMPDCAPAILKLDSKKEKRKWRSIGDLGTTEEERTRRLANLRETKTDDDRPPVRTFVSDHWTLEYDLAMSGLQEEVHLAAALANKDEQIAKGSVTRQKVAMDASTSYSELATKYGTDEEIASAIYALISKKKPIAAQYLSDILSEKCASGALSRSQLRSRIPRYIIDALDYVTGGAPHDGDNADDVDA